MKKYDNYKDSGIEWIGKIPEHWNVKKLKFISKICNGQDQKTVLDDFGNYPIYGSGGIFGRANSYLFDKPSVLLGRKGTIDKPQYVEEPFWTVDTSYYTKIKDGFSTRLFYYLCTTINFELYKYGSAIPSMTQGHLNEIKFSIPNCIEEQTQIANYLDHKTTQIDTLITKKEQFISLLQEERTAIINQAVSKGLDPTVPMKDSCIDWLGEIPEYWEVKRIKYIVKIISGYSFKSDDFTRKGVRVMKISNIQTMRVDWTDDSYLPEEFLIEYERFKINKGDLVFALTRPIISTGIKATIVTEQEDVLLNQRNAVLKPSAKLNVRWMYYMIFNEKFKEHFESLIDGTGQQPNISSNDIANIHIPLPNFGEQNEIVAFLDSKTEEIEIIIRKSKQEIELLKEYKTALISEVVTGKVDVRNKLLN